MWMPPWETAKSAVSNLSHRPFYLAVFSDSENQHHPLGTYYGDASLSKRRNRSQRQKGALVLPSGASTNAVKDTTPALFMNLLAELFPGVKLVDAGA